MNEKPAFIKNDFIVLLQPLNSGDTGKWGKMNAQQMVEHVSDFFSVSSGRLHYPVITPAEKLPQYKAFLLSDKEFRENTKAPPEVLGEAPLPLRNSSMEMAISELRNSIEEFAAFFAGDPEKTSPHPVFGELNFAEWVQLHYKHLLHHAKQFGLL